MEEIMKYETPSGEVELTARDVRQYINTNPKVTDKEIYTFMQMCKYGQLNPYMREAYLIKYGDNQATFVVGKDAFTKRADSHSQFDGFAAGIIVKIPTDNEGVYRTDHRPGAMLYDGEVLLGGWARVHRKDRKEPFYNECSMAEYAKPHGSWASIPATMIRKVPLVQSLREAFPDLFGGLYSEEEMPIDDTKLPRDAIEPTSEGPVVDASWEEDTTLSTPTVSKPTPEEGAEEKGASTTEPVVGEIHELGAAVGDEKLAELLDAINTRAFRGWSADELEAKYGPAMAWDGPICAEIGAALRNLKTSEDVAGFQTVHIASEPAEEPPRSGKRRDWTGGTTSKGDLIDNVKSHKETILGLGGMDAVEELDIPTDSSLHRMNISNLTDLKDRLGEWIRGAKW